MKFSKSGRQAAVSAIALALATLFTGCASTTSDYLYVTSSKAAGANNFGEIDVYAVDHVSGALRPLATSPFPSGGRNPVSIVAAPNSLHLYVINNDDDSIVMETVGTDGKLYPQATFNTPGSYPIAAAVYPGSSTDGYGAFLYVVDVFDPTPGCSTANPCSGALVVYPIIQKSDGTGRWAGALGTLTGVSSSNPDGTPSGQPIANGSLNYWPLTLTSGDVFSPTSINLLDNGSYLYIAGTDATTGNSGWVFGFATSASGTVTAATGSPYAAGSKPSAIASPQNSGSLYVTDALNGQILGYTVGSNGALTSIPGSPYAAGAQPSAVGFDPTGSVLYATNALDSTVWAYSISSQGALTKQEEYATDSDPVAITVIPRSPTFLYTANYLGSDVSGLQIGSSSANLLNTQNTPYLTNAQPTAMVWVPHPQTQTN